MPAVSVARPQGFTIEAPSQRDHRDWPGQARGMVSYQASLMLTHQPVPTVMAGPRVGLRPPEDRLRPATTTLLIAAAKSWVIRLRGP